MRKKISLIGSLAIIVAALMWAFDGVFLTPSLFHLDVVVVVFLLHAFPSLYLIFFLLIEWKELYKMKAKDWGAFVLVSVFGGAVGTLAITKALFFVNFVPLTVVVLLQKLQPVFAVLMAVFILKEHPPKIFYLFACVALLGSYLVTFGFSLPVFDIGNVILQAAGLSLLAAFSFGSSTVFSKRALRNVNYRVGTALRFVMTAIFMFFVVVVMHSWTGFSAIRVQDIGTFLLIAITTGGVAILLYYFGLKKVMASQSTILELAFPAGAIVMDYFIHGTILHIGQWIGVVLLLISITRISFITKPTQE